jgi:opacity protein-like surface antigen
MRLLTICGAALISLVEPSIAADFPILRGSRGLELGPPAYFRWDGVYIGGQASYSSGEADFSNGTSGLIAYILRNTTIENEAHVSQWTTLSKSDAVGVGYGGFIGYNAQWGDAIMASSSTTIARICRPPHPMRLGVPMKRRTATSTTSM